MSKRSSEEFSEGPHAKLGQKTEKEDKGRIENIKKPKLAFSIGKKPLNTKSNANVVSSNSEVKKEPLKKKDSLKAAFNSDSEEEEEMPPEARMRMRNIGRDTPTSAGPNSFGKTKQGFCDAKKVFEKKLKAAAEKSRETN